MKHYLLFLLSLCASGGALLAQNPLCDVFVWPTGYANGTTTLTAFDSSSAPSTSYAWSTGAATPEIQVGSDGEYCVSATNLINGCVATSCTWVQPDSACYVQINSVSPDPATLQLSAAGGPDPLSSYAWSTGETTPAIAITESGHYGVTVTNTAGCTVSGYTFVYPANDLSVQVLLSDTSNLGNAGVFADIYLIQYDTVQGGILTAIDTVATYSWTNDWAFVNMQNIPGLAPVSITVTIGPGQPSVTGANFKVDDNSIALPVQNVVDEKPVKIFPNPAHDVLTVELPAAAELTLTNAQGQVAQRTFENGAVARLPLRDLPAGIYFLTARMANSTQVLKVMIE